MNNLEYIQQDEVFEYESSSNNQYGGHQSTPSTSDYQKILLKNMLKETRGDTTDKNQQKQTIQQYPLSLNGTTTNQMLKRRSMSSNGLKMKQQIQSDFSDNHLQNAQNIPNQLVVKIKESINCQPPQVIMRRSQSQQVKKRQRILSYNSIMPGQQQSLQQQTQQQFYQNQQSLNQPIQMSKQQSKPQLSVSIQNKIKIESIQREQIEQQQLQQPKDLESESYITNQLQQQQNQQNSKKLTNRQQIYIDIFLKQKKTLDLSTANTSLLQKDNDQTNLTKIQNQFTTPHKQYGNLISNQQQQQQQQQFQQKEEYSSGINQEQQVKSKNNGNISSNLSKALLSSRPSSNAKLRSNDVKQRKQDEIIEIQDLSKLQSAYQSISIKERSPNRNPYYSSSKQSRSNSIQTPLDLTKYYQSEEMNVNIPVNQQKNLMILQKIIQSESILLKLNNPQCRHSHYLEVQDKIKDMSNLIIDVYSEFLKDSGKSISQINDLGFFSLFLSSLQKAFSEINSFISKVVIALPEQHAVDQMKNVKNLLEVINKMNSPTLFNEFRNQSRQSLNDQKLKYIQELSLLPTQSTLKFVELFNDLDKYFQIYQEQIEQFELKIEQQEEQIKEISDMLYGAENTINMKNQLHQSQYFSNQLYHEKEEMLLKLNQSIEQNYTIRISELKQVEQLNSKELEESKKTINLLNKQINELKEKLRVSTIKKKTQDQSSQINMIILNNDSRQKKFQFKFQKYIRDEYPSPFRFSTGGVLAVINSVLSDKVKDDYTAFIAKLPYEPLYRYTALWFMKQFGQQEVASAFLNDFIESIQEMAERERQIEFYCSLVGLSAQKMKEEMQTNRGTQGIQSCIKSIMLQSNLFYQIYYGIAQTYRNKLEEKSDNYNRPYFFHTYKQDEEIPLKKAQQIVAHHLRGFLQDQEELDNYIEQFVKIELTQHIYTKTFKQFNFAILKQNMDLVEGNDQQSFSKQLKKNSQITVPLSNIGQFVVDCIANIESERLVQFIYSLKTSQLEKLNKQLSIEEYKSVMQQFYPTNNKQFYANTFAEYCLTNVVKIFETSSNEQHIKYLEKFTTFVIDNRTQDVFYAQIGEGQQFESPRTSPHSPKKLKHSNSIKSFSHIKLENTNKSSNDLDNSPTKTRNNKSLKKKKSAFYQGAISSKNLESNNDLNGSSLSPSEDQSPSKIRGVHIINFQSATKSAPQSPKKLGSQSPKKLGSQSPKKLGIVQSQKRYDSISPSKSSRNVSSPIRTQQEFFFSTRILFRQEFENKAIDAFFKQHLNTFASIVIIEEVYNNLTNLIKKEQQTEERIRKIHDSFKYYLQTAKNQPYITTNYIARHDFIQYIINAWDELRTILKFLASNFSKPSNNNPY